MCQQIYSLGALTTCRLSVYKTIISCKSLNMLKKQPQSCTSTEHMRKAPTVALGTNLDGYTHPQTSWWFQTLIWTSYVRNIMISLATWGSKGPWLGKRSNSRPPNFDKLLPDILQLVTSVRGAKSPPEGQQVFYNLYPLQLGHGKTLPWISWLTFQLHLKGTQEYWLLLTDLAKWQGFYPPKNLPQLRP